MKNFTIAFTVVLVASSMTRAAAQDVLIGDTRLACEAILCLSAASPPGECTPALSRYFGISFSKPKNTARARANFLNMCPQGKQGQQVPSSKAQPAGNSAMAADLPPLKKTNQDESPQSR